MRKLMLVPLAGLLALGPTWAVDKPSETQPRTSAEKTTPGAQPAKSQPTAAVNPSGKETPPEPISGIFIPHVEFEGVSGSRQRAGLYVLRKSYPAVDFRNVKLLTGHGFDTLDLFADDLFGPRFDLGAGLWNPGMPAVIKGVWDRATFYEDPLAPPIPGARSHTALQARIKPIIGLRLHANYDRQNVNYPVLLREGRINYSVQDAGLGFDAPLGPGVLSFRLGNLDFHNKFVGQPNSSDNRYDLSYSTALGTNATIGAMAQWATIHQPGFRSSNLFQLGFAGSYQPTHQLYADARVHFRSMDLGPTANAFVRKSTGGGVQFTYLPARQLRLRAGLDYSQYERFNALESAVDKPHELRVSARGDWRVNHNAKASAEYQYRSLTGLNPSVVPLITNPSPLFFDLEHRLSLRASTVFNKQGLAYGFYNFRVRTQSQRFYHETTNTAGLGASYPVLPNLTLGADLFWRQIDTNLPFLAGWDADGFVGHFGLGWDLTPKWHFSADYNRAETYYGENSDLNYISLGLSADTGHGQSLRVGYHRDDLGGSIVPQINYGTDVFSVGYVAPF